MLNSKRIFTDCLRRYCDANGIRLTAKSHDWIFILEKTGQKRLVVGYDLGLNSSTTHRIVNDKAATFDVLSHFDIPAVPHHVFLHPEFSGYISSAGNWKDMADLFEHYGRDIVIKPNEGTGGQDVNHVTCESQLEETVQNLFVRNRSVCLSPFLTIDREIRVFLCDRKAILAYEKHVPFVTGDGEQTLSMLIEREVRDGRLSLKTGFSSALQQGLDPKRVLKEGETVKLTWKHNLGQGSRAVIHDTPSKLPGAAPLAERAAEAVSLNFGTIDIVYVNGHPQVLEINSGVMMETLAVQHTKGLDLAYWVYGQGLEFVFKD